MKIFTRFHNCDRKLITFLLYRTGLLCFKAPARAIQYQHVNLLETSRLVRYSLSKIMNHKVFVYGTLKRNEPNHHWLTNRDHGVGKYVCDGATKTKYPLIIATKYNIPFLLYSPGEGNHVKGEIYNVDDNMLTQLDILEDHPSYYVRELDDIKVIKPGSEQQPEEMKCWVYFLKKFKQELLSRPLLEAYSSRGGHGLPYLERSKRDPNYDYKPEVMG